MTQFVRAQHLGSKCGKLKEVEKGTLIPGWSSKARLNQEGVVCLSFCLAPVLWPRLEAPLAKIEGTNPLGDWDQLFLFFFYFSFGDVCGLFSHPLQQIWLLDIKLLVLGMGWGEGGGLVPSGIYTQAFSFLGCRTQ